MEKGKDLWWKPGISKKEKELTKEKIAEAARAYEDLETEIAVLKMKHKRLENEDNELATKIKDSGEFIELTTGSGEAEEIQIAKFEEEKKREFSSQREDLEPQILDIEDQIKDKEEQLKSLPQIGKDSAYHILEDENMNDRLAPLREKLFEAKAELDVINKLVEVLTQRIEEKKEELEKYIMNPPGKRTQVGIAHRKSMLTHLEKTLETKEEELRKMADFYLDLKNKLDKMKPN